MSLQRRRRTARRRARLELAHLRGPDAPARAPRPLGPRPELRADHQLGQAARGLERAGRTSPPPVPAAQDRGAVAERADLVQLVADVEDRAALRRELRAACRTARSTSCGVSTEVGSSMISSLRVLQQAAHDLDPLALADRERRGRCAPGRAAGRSAAATSAIPRLARPGMRRAGRRAPSAMFSATVSASNSEKCWNTMPMPRRARRVGSAIATGWPSPGDLAGVGLQHAVDDLHQRRLAGAVLAQQRVDLARGHFQRDVVVRQHRAVALDDAGEPQQGCRRCCLHWLPRAMLHPRL